MSPGTYNSYSKRLAQELAETIRRGQWPAGSQLPSTRDLAERYRVSRGTIQSVLGQLESQRLIERHPRRRPRVRSLLPRPTACQREHPGSRQVLLIREAIPADYLQMSWGNTILEAAKLSLLERGFDSLTVTYLSRDNNIPETLLRQIDNLGGQPAGVICMEPTSVPGLLTELDQRNVPWVSMKQPAMRWAYNFVTTDFQDMGFQAGLCFAKMGCERLLVLTSRYQHWGSNHERLMGLVRGYVTAGMPIDAVQPVRCEPGEMIPGYQAMLQYLDQQGLPQGIFTMGDTIALGALKALRESGVRVPDEVGIMSSTGMAFSAHTTPPLTTLVQPMEQIGQHLANMLNQMIREGTRRLLGRHLRATFAFRESLLVPPALRQELQALSRSEFSLPPYAANHLPALGGAPAASHEHAWELAASGASPPGCR